MLASLCLAAALGTSVPAAANTDAQFFEALSEIAAIEIPKFLERAQPDLQFTPGRLCTPDDPNFQEYRYPEHIAYCRRNVTEPMKKYVADHYSVSRTQWGLYEFDHLLPLGIGGDSSVYNLWPQPRGNPDGSDDKDQLEADLFQQMKAGAITQNEAVRRIYGWFNGSELAKKAIRIGAR